ncbi:hypothetical protein SMU101_00075 [Streptococcus mutans U2B]|nr:hypothetical protein SMU101_00075 [Streptococcus mutans U2B]
MLPSLGSVVPAGLSDGSVGVVGLTGSVGVVGSTGASCGVGSDGVEGCSEGVVGSVGTTDVSAG